MDQVVAHLQDGSVCLEVTLSATQVTLNPEAGKPLAAIAVRIAKKLRQPEASFLCADGSALEGDCAKLQTGSVLRIGETTLPVFVNPPSVQHLSVPAYPMVGLPVMPNVVLRHTEAAAWRWLRDQDVLSSERLYVPRDADVGFNLSCECTPLPDGVPVVAQSEVVRPAPDLVMPSETQSVGDFRVLTYNLLADYNLKADLANDDPDYFHLTPEEQDFQYRRQMLLREIARFHAHILCFQEVDRDGMYNNFLQGQLQRMGYEGVYAKKVHTSTPVGNAVFWCTDRWRLVTTEVLDLTHGEAIQSLLEASPSLGFAMGKTTTVANLVVLEDDLGRRLVVVNLHLFGDPSAPHIRLLQCYLALRAARRYDAPLLLCGDFNCGPQTGVCELLTVGHVDEEHSDWVKGRSFQWGALCEKRVDVSSLPEDQWCPAMHLSHASRLETAGCTGFTFWNGRRGHVVDHIFFDSSALRACSFMAGTPLSVIREHGVASTAFPSDHVALVADLSWISP